MEQVQDWDDAYANGVHIPQGDRWPERWRAAAADARGRWLAAGRARLDQPYGPDARHRFDLFLPPDVPRGLVVFVHGGFWMALDKSYWSHLAAGPLAHGFAVAIPSYTLCPAIRIGDIAAEVAAATATAAALIAGPIALTGHSAGGHLVTRMVSDPSPLDAAVRGRIAHVLSISGLHDLRPLLRTTMNATLRLDVDEARAESPALLEPLPATRLTCWVGSEERPEFVRQSALLANVWRGLGAATETVIEPARHHFDVVDGLADPSHRLVEALLRVSR